MLRTQITPPRVDFIDPRTGKVSREWYMFLLSLNSALGGSVLSLEDLQKSSESFDNSELYQLTNELQSLPPSVLPVALNDSSVQVSTVLNDLREIRKQLDALQLAPPLQSAKRCRYGQFLDTTTQLAAVINTPYAITYNTSDISNGVYLGTPASRMYVDEASVYNFLVSVQLDKSAGGIASFWIWPRVNGVDVANSASQIRIQGNDAEVLGTVGFLLDLKSGDYVEFMFAVSDISVELKYFASTGFTPAIPSIIVTVTNNIEGNSL